LSNQKQRFQSGFKAVEKTDDTGSGKVGRREEANPVVNVGVK
jgi:hypothetical protein